MSTQQLSNVVHSILTSGDHFVVQVKGSCMYPLLKDGDQLNVFKTTKISPGDVIVFSDNDALMTVHRFLGWLPWKGVKHAMTKADNGKKIDRLIVEDNVLGRVVEVNEVALRVRASHRLFASAKYMEWLARLTVKRILSLFSS